MLGDNARYTLVPDNGLTGLLPSLDMNLFLFFFMCVPCGCSCGAVIWDPILLLRNTLKLLARVAKRCRGALDLEPRLAIWKPSPRWFKPWVLRGWR